MKMLLLFNGEASSLTLVENIATHNYEKPKLKEPKRLKIYRISFLVSHLVFFRPSNLFIGSKQALEALDPRKIVLESPGYSWHSILPN